jgi:hypothetical protein
MSIQGPPDLKLFSTFDATAKLGKTVNTYHHLLLIFNNLRLFFLLNRCGRFKVFPRKCKSFRRLQRLRFRAIYIQTTRKLACPTGMNFRKCGFVE